MFQDLLQVLVAVIGGGILLYAAVTGFTTLAAVVQMGSIQERAMPWADMSKQRSGQAARATSPEKAPAKPVIAAETVSSAISSSVGAVSHVAASSGSRIVDRLIDRAIGSHAKDPLERIKFLDQVTYTVSLINVMITAYLMGIAPHYFYIWHTPKAILYTAHRWHTFKKQNQHYLLYDFCYWANALSIVYCWLCPDNAVMFQIIFMVSNGPLAWAVLAFSQSLIFHSAPHMTSVFIHTSPMLLTYALRWSPSNFTVCSNWPECRDENTGVLTMLYNAHVKFYLWWVVLYYLWVYLVMNRRIQERGYKTLFDRVSNRGPTKFLAKISTNDLVQKSAYMIVHIAFATFTMLLATAYWRSQVAHTIFIILILATSAWNASGFYFTVFANKYSDEVRARAFK
jgi:hypothetical protein